MKAGFTENFLRRDEVDTIFTRHVIMWANFQACTPQISDLETILEAVHSKFGAFASAGADSAFVWS